VDPAQIWSRLTTLAASLTRAQQITLATSFVAVVVLVGGATAWMQAVEYRLLFSDLDAEAAADVVTRLKDQDVPYKLEDGGRTVRVAEDRLDELRLDFAGRGLPSSGRIGFEIFDRTSFGATDFQEQVSYRRALEGELARTIASLSEVAEARVHIALAKDSLFLDDRQQAKASITLKLRQNRPLPPSTARAIATLAASSVEGLEPEAVVIVDTSGRALNAPKRDDAESVLLEGDQRIERELTAQLVAMLEPVVGAGGVRVNVSADLTRHTEEETEERFDPNPVVRSRSVNNVTDSTMSAGRVAGARSNTPGVTPADGPATTLVAGRGSEVTNYEVGKTVRHSIKPGGDLARLSVAVVIDDERVATAGDDGRVSYTAKRRDAAQLRKIQNLVAAAVGFNPARGDQLTVENISFEEVTMEERTNVPIPAWRQYVPLALTVGRWLAIAGLAAFALFFVIRPAIRSAFPAPSTALAPATLPEELPRTVQELQDELDARLDNVDPARTFRVRASTEVGRRVSAIAKGNPEDTARLLRSWLVEDAR
jgi:flagellar M-ring protein FliF